MSDALTQAGVAELNDGRPAQAAERFLAALRADPAQEQAWLGLALALAFEGKLGDLIGLTDYRQRVRGDGFLFFHGAAGMLVGYRLYDHVRALARMLLDASPYHLPAAYNAGCAALLQGDEDDGFAQFVRFKQLAAGQAASLPIGPESPFNVAWRQATLIEDRPYVEALDESTAIRARLPVPEFTGPAPGPAGATLAAACDARYFRLFAPGFVRSAAAQCPTLHIHFHLIGPDEAALALFAELAAATPGLTLNLSTETAGPYRSGAYYASSRFLVGPALLRRYGGRLVLTDIDVEFDAPPGDLLDATRECDFAGFRHDGAGPCSRYPAVLTVWNSGTASLDLLDRVGRFVLSKLDVEWPFNWMLDQAALGSVLRWAAQARPACRIGIINDLTGKHYQPWLRSVGGAEKAVLIREAGQAG
ncbi:MAG: hypothetical protein QOJ54_1232 [Aliidongia sp.]|nr:hypothetical protein [Aliidongia sp.]